jgi:hypothetical protein
MSTQFHPAITTGRGRIFKRRNVNDREAAQELAGEAVECLVMADRGYGGDEFHRILKGNNAVPVIPGRKNRKKAVAYNEQKYRKRSFIGRIFGKIKENRRLTVQYEPPRIYRGRFP